MRKNYIACSVLSLLLTSSWLMAQNRAENPFLPTIQSVEDAHDPVIRKLYESGGPLSRFKPEAEDASKRTLTAKHFKTGDNQYKAVIGAGPVHFWENGAWHTISDEIVPNTSARHTDYVRYNKWNEFKTYYGTSDQGVLIEMSGQGQGVQYGKNAQMVWLDANQQTISATPVAPNVLPGYSHGELVYPYVFPEVDAHIRQLVTGFESSYILNNAHALDGAPTHAHYLAFVEEMVLPTGWSAILTKNAKSGQQDNVIVKDANGKVKSTYQVPRFWDKPGVNPYAGERKTLNNITGSYKITQQGNVVKLFILVPTEWVLSPERNFPVTIDPVNTVTTPNSSNAAGSIVPQNSPYWTGFTDTGASGTEPSMRLGFEDDTGVFSGNSNNYYEPFMQFDLASLPDHIPNVSRTVICNTELYVYQNAYDDGDPCSACASERGQFTIGRINTTPPDPTVSFAAISNAINNMVAYTGPYGWNSTGSGLTNYNPYTLGWRGPFNLGLQANADISDSLGANKIAIGFRNEFLSHSDPGFQLFNCGGFHTCADNDFVTWTGHNVAAQRPYLVIEYQSINEPTLWGNGNNSSPNDDWYVWGYNGNDLFLNPGLVQLRGFYQSAGLNVNTATAWAANTTPHNAANWVGCSVNVNDHTVVHRRRGFPCGQYNVSIANISGNARVFINGALIGNYGAPATIWTDTLSAASTIEIRHAKSVGNSNIVVTFTRIDDWKASGGPDQQLCFGDTLFLNGTITNLAGTGAGVPPCTNSNPPNCQVTYEWLGTGLSPNPYPFQNATIQNVSASATYFLNVTSSIGCVSRDTIVVTVPPPPVATVTPVPNVICSGGTTNINLSSNLPGTVFNWTRNNNFFVSGTNGQNGVGAGAINIVLTNNTGSTQQVDFTVIPIRNGCEGAPVVVPIYVQPVPIINTLMSSANPLCSGETANILVGSPNMPSTIFSWTFAPTVNGAIGATQFAGIGTSINVGLTNATAGSQNGTFTITASSPTGCPVTPVAVPITVNPAPNAIINAPVLSICTGGTATLTALPAGMSYLWTTTQNTQVINATTGGNYGVTVTNAFNCTDNASVTIVENPLPPINAVQVFIDGNPAGSPNPSLCQGAGIVTLNGFIGSQYSYQWSLNGSVLPPPTGSNGTLTLTNPQQSGTYVLTVTSIVSGCSRVVPAQTITIYPAVTNATLVTSNAAPSPLCADAGVNLIANASGGTQPYQYQWYANGSVISSFPGTNTQPAIVPPSISSLSASYSVIVQDNNGCKDTTNNYTIHSHPVAELSTISAPQLPYCDGDTVQVSATGGSTYTWGAVAPGVLAPSYSVQNNLYITHSGTYYAVVANTVGCTDTAYTQALTFNATPNSSIFIAPGQDSILCANETTILTALPAGAANYVWTLNGALLPDTTSAITAATSGTYTVVITNALGCDKAVSQGISVTDTLALTLAPSNLDGHFCEGGQIILSVNGPSHQWFMNGVSAYNANPFIINQTNYTAPGNVSVTVTDAQGCQSHAAYQVTMDTLPDAAILNTPSTGEIILCNGQDTILIGSPSGAGYSYQWLRDGLFPVGSGKDLIVAANSSTTFPAYYSLSVSSARGCVSTSTPIKLSLNPEPYGEILSVGEPHICQGKTLDLMATATVGDFIWVKDGAPFVTVPNQSPITVSAPGSYNIVVSNICGSYSAPAPIVVTQSNDITASFVYMPTEVHVMEAVTFTNYSINANFATWDFGDSYNSASFNTTHGFINTGNFEVQLTVFDELGCSDDTTVTVTVIPWGDPFIPNIFTPNGDGTHDEWEIYYADLEGILTRVYDRWGNLVFETGSKNIHWKGFNKSGSESAAGVYYYQISATKPNGEKVNLKGNVTLMR